MIEEDPDVVAAAPHGWHLHHLPPGARSTSPTRQHPRNHHTLDCSQFPEEICWTLAGPFAGDENRCAHVAFRRRFGLVCEAVEEIGAGALPGSGVPGCAYEREYQPPRSY